MCAALLKRNRFNDSQASGILTTGPCPEVRRNWLAFNPVIAYSPHSRKQPAIFLPVPDLPLKAARKKWMEKFGRNYWNELLNRCRGNISEVARRGPIKPDD